MYVSSCVVQHCSVPLNTHWNLHSMFLSHEYQAAEHLTHDTSDMNDEDLPSFMPLWSDSLTMYIILYMQLVTCDSPILYPFTLMIVSLLTHVTLSYSPHI